MKQQFLVYNENNAVVDVLTVTKLTGQFALLRSTQEKIIELFLPVSSFSRKYFVDTQLHAIAFITLN